MVPFFLVLFLLSVLFIVNIVTKKNEDEIKISNENNKYKAEIEKLKEERRKCEAELNQAYAKKVGEVSQLEDKIKELEHNAISKSKYCEETIKKTVEKYEEQIRVIKKENIEFIEKQNFELEKMLQGNTRSIPYIADMVSDYLTLHYERVANYLAIKSNPAIEESKRIRDLRIETKDWIRRSKIAIYSLEYLKNLLPSIDDLLEIDYEELKPEKITIEYDPIRNYLSADEWKNLSETEKNQKALDNYINGSKTKWQIGRDYELYIGYNFWKQGYNVIYFGSVMGLEDLGRDLIVDKNEKIVIIQCKCWAKDKTIHEKHIAQLYGSLIHYIISNKKSLNDVSAELYTTTRLSEMAKEFSKILKIKYNEGILMDEFPRIKCNIGRDERGLETRIYHLPMDQQYDSAIINKSGEFFAFSVEEAEKKGFRRAWKFSGLKS